MLHLIGGLLLLSVGMSVPLMILRDRLAASTVTALRVFSNLPIIAGGVAGLYAEGLEASEWRVMFWGLIVSGSALVLWQIKTWNR